MDFDGDGDFDLLTGSYNAKLSVKGAALFIALAKDSSFASPHAISDQRGVALTLEDVRNDHADTRKFRRPNASDPHCADWDGDGDLDLIVGSMEGEITLLRNVGTRKAPRYARPGNLLRHAGRPIRVPGGHGAPVLADWDADGKVDLLSGSGSGAVFWFRNSSAKGDPRYEEGRMLVGPTFSKAILPANGPQHPGGHSRVEVVDWNGDGRVDLLIGDAWPPFSRALRPELSDDERKRAAELLAEHELVVRRSERVEWEREMEMWKLGRRPRGIFPRYLARLEDDYARLDALEAKLEAALAPQSSHGFVWLLLRRKKSSDQKR